MTTLRRAEQESVCEHNHHRLVPRCVLTLLFPLFGFILQVTNQPKCPPPDPDPPVFQTDPLDGQNPRVQLEGMPEGPKQQELQETKPVPSTTMIDCGPQLPKEGGLWMTDRLLRLPKEGGLRFPKE